MSETEENKHLIEVALPEGGFFILHDIDELEKWINTYGEKWDWVQNYARNNNTEHHQMANQIKSFIQNINNQLNSYKTANINQKTQHLNNIQNTFKGQIGKGWIDEDNPKILFALQDPDEQCRLIKIRHFTLGIHNPGSLV